MGKRGSKKLTISPEVPSKWIQERTALCTKTSDDRLRRCEIWMQSIVEFLDEYVEVMRNVSERDKKNRKVDLDPFDKFKSDLQWSQKSFNKDLWADIQTILEAFSNNTVTIVKSMIAENNLVMRTYFRLEMEKTCKTNS